MKERKSWNANVENYRSLNKSVKVSKAFKQCNRCKVLLKFSYKVKNKGLEHFDLNLASNKIILITRKGQFRLIIINNFALQPFNTFLNKFLF